jgi:hypothetical protein
MEAKVEEKPELAPLGFQARNGYHRIFGSEEERAVSGHVIDS